MWKLSNKSITIDNLALVCDALEISLKDFFDEPEKPSEIIDKELLSAVNRLTLEQKTRLINFLKLI